MKNHIVFKFIAVMLCALFLLTAAGSGIGIIAFTTSDFYEKTVDEVYDEAIGSLSDAFAGQIATRYASKTLGGCPEEMLDYYGRIFTPGYYGYALKDADGNVLEELEVPDHAAARYFSIDLTGRRYQKLISVTPESELRMTVPPTDDDYTFRNQVPVSGTTVTEMRTGGPYGLLDKVSVSDLGEIFYCSDGRIIFHSNDPLYISTDELITYVVFTDNEGILFEANCQSGVGDFFNDSDGCLHFISKVTTEGTTSDTGYVLYDAVPPGGTEVQEIFVDFLHGDSESCGSEGGLGVLFYSRDGEIRFNAFSTNYFLSETGPVTHVSFKDAQGNLLYEAGSDDGSAVGIIYENEDGLLCYESLRTQEDTVPATTELVTIPETTTAVTEMPTEIPTEAPTEDIPTVITDNMERLGVQVATITIFDEKGYSTNIQRDTAFGYLSRNDDGTVTFRSNKDITLPENVDTQALNHIAFLDVQGRLLYEIQSPNGVGYFSDDQPDRLIFTSTVTPADVEAAKAAATEVPTEVPTESPTEAPTEVPTEVPTEPPTEAVADKANIIAEVTEPILAIEEASDFFTTSYWDSELQEHVQAEFAYEELPEGYVLELWLLHGAYELDPIYDLLQFIWQYRTDLFYVLGVSVLLFAVFAVYLCCAAGRKPGSTEVKAEGINALPLDVYVTGGFLAICGLVILCVEGGYYLLRNSPHVIAPYILIAGYIAALIIVGFCFACAAQFKTPGGYWWKNTLCARIIRLIIRFGAWLERFLGTKFFPFLGRILKFCWRNGIKLCKALWKYGSIWAVAGFHALEKALIWLGKGLGKIAQRTYAWLHAFLSLLPVTWQWLIIGLFLLFFLFLSILTRSEGFMVLGVIAGIALVVYGSHCFGILWDSTKKMSKGDLELKVDDKLMVGAFKDFASDLNALADVAVVAAQKQLKSERMKTELITNVSHDIKTPLTSIINYVDLLQKPHTDEEQEIYLEVLSRQSLQMKKLLEDLIDMSKASTGNMAVYVTRLNASEAVSQALGEFADKLEKAQLTPVIRQPEEDVYMQADGRLVWRVLSNILSNVVKYALPGTRVYIDLNETDGKVLISVKNISREELNVHADELMERFVRGDASRNTEGSGLGLNIAQSLMDIQKGKLELLVDGDLFKVTLTFPGAES